MEVANFLYKYIKKEIDNQIFRFIKKNIINNNK